MRKVTRYLQPREFSKINNQSRNHGGQMAMAWHSQKANYPLNSEEINMFPSKQSLGEFTTSRSADREIRRESFRLKWKRWTVRWTHPQKKGCYCCLSGSGSTGCGASWRCIRGYSRSTKICGYSSPTASPAPISAHSQIQPTVDCVIGIYYWKSFAQK